MLRILKVTNVDNITTPRQSSRFVGRVPGPCRTGPLLNPTRKVRGGTTPQSEEVVVGLIKRGGREDVRTLGQLVQVMSIHVSISFI